MNIDFRTLKRIGPAGCRFVGNTKLSFRGIQSVYDSGKDDITWIKPGVRDEKKLVNTTGAGGIICTEGLFECFEGDLEKKLFILHENPKSVFSAVTKFVHEKSSAFQKTGALIHPSAIVHPGCRLGKNVRIGAYSTIGACHIGDNTMIYNHVHIEDCVTIGANCVIREFCSIGGEGFGFDKNEEGINEHIPHLGSVVIEDNVSIYPFSNVDRGTLGKTTIKKGTAIDHFVHIGHNTTTGENNLITACTVLAGGSMIRDNCFIGVNTLLMQKRIIGSNVITGMGSVVLKDIPDNEVWVGNPARYLKSSKG